MALFKKKANKKPEAKSAKIVDSQVDTHVSADSKPKKQPKSPGIFRRIGGYFKGSWQELSQTKWPTRKATWSLTVAVIVFTTLLMIFIILLDNFFGWLFEQLVL